MNIIKLNYNNLYVKEPQHLNPTFFTYRYRDENNVPIIVIQLDDQMQYDNFFDDYSFELYIEGDLIAILTKDSYKVIDLRNNINYYRKHFSILVTGYYYNSSGYKQEVYIQKSIENVPECSEHMLCSEHTIVNDIIEGYLYDNNFYVTRALVNNEYQYSDLIDDKTFGAYYDISDDKVYKWDIETSSFVII